MHRDAPVAWVPVCPRSALGALCAVKAATTPPVAVFDIDGELYAVSDTCTHGESSLSEGYVEPDGRVECVAHMAEFSVKTGEALTLPATDDLQTYAVKVEDGMILVAVPQEP
ncbi:non-heme iron oxygenase ferredoxin subunit [Streptomyces sp. GbtcB6]|uniref:non-heme iron oxygenase ferredoxin subunit n=1 Tax=Streptomyces sp. GbtcB6 TaxID=2824751 RepID=UPI001C305E50|nr:non-heme iron oxygenase ferredoxin subunit [Streptomyces sp. GbtcB6]